MATHAPPSRRLAEPRRTATVLSTMRHLERASVDDTLTLFGAVLTTKPLAASAGKARKRVLGDVGTRSLPVPPSFRLPGRPHPLVISQKLKVASLAPHSPSHPPVLPGAGAVHWLYRAPGPLQLRSQGAGLVLAAPP